MKNRLRLQLYLVFFSFVCLQLHTDLDVGGKNIKYVLAGEGAGTIFAINELTGDIHAMKRLDREEKAEYTLTAQVVNADTDEPLEPPSEFIIKVQDINDNPPQFIEGPYRASVPEMSAVGKSHTDFLSAPCRTRQPNQSVRFQRRLISNGLLHKNNERIRTRGNECAYLHACLLWVSWQMKIQEWWIKSHHQNFTHSSVLQLNNWRECQHTLKEAV